MQGKAKEDEKGQNAGECENFESTFKAAMRQLDISSTASQHIHLLPGLHG